MLAAWVFATAGWLAAAPPPGYRLVWQDAFDGTSLDTARWQYRTDERHWSTQLPANVSVSDGLLHLHLKKETVGTMDYTAGGVISRDLFRYGYYEASMKVPPGRGWHTSFWMMKYNRPATDTVAIELDVIENDSISPLKYAVNLHRHLPLPHLPIGTKTINTPSLSGDFHLFGCEFTPTSIKYFFDGDLVQTVDATALPHDDMNIWLTSIASSLGGTPSVDDTQLPAVAQFDFVRFYEPFPAPVVGIASPAAPAVHLSEAATDLHLLANVTAPDGPLDITWTVIDGPAAVVFSDPSAAATQVSFAVPGSYTIQCTAANEGGAGSARLGVGVATPTTMLLRQGEAGYSHAATIIRGDFPDWNGGARDQTLAGRSTDIFRSLYSFDLSPVPANAEIQEARLILRAVGGTGSVGNLKLRALAATPVEGIGIATGTANASIGAGTGATWTSRTGGSDPAAAWLAPGGDFLPPVLAEYPGFSVASGLEISFPPTPEFTAAATAAHGNGQTLDIVLSADNESGTAPGFVRLGSDDAGLPDERPVLAIRFSGGGLPVVDIGTAPAARAGVPCRLQGAVTGADSTLWEMVSGPEAVVMDSPAMPATGIVFPRAGEYQIRLSAATAGGTVSRTLIVQVGPADPAYFGDWQAVAWPGQLDEGVVGEKSDPDGDGLANLLEWALHLEPNHPGVFRPVVQAGPPQAGFTYTRRKIAAGEGMVHAEWSSTLEADWTRDGLVESEPVSLSETMESVVVALPVAAGDRCFFRVRVERP